jgi:hypothetical protein
MSCDRSPNPRRPAAHARRRGRALAAIVALAGLLAPSTALAQACCAGASAVTPGRLAVHEDALVGVQARIGSVLGNHDERRRFRSAPSSSHEQDGELDLIGALRVLGQGQIAVLFPAVTTRRSLSGRSELGGGVGDVNLGARYDLTLAGASAVVPGISLLAGVTLPTGRSPEEASGALATDATGLGTWQATVGVGAEQLFGKLLLGATALASRRGTRRVAGLESTLATRLSALASAAYTFDSDAALALSIAYAAEGAATIDGAEAAGSQQASTTVALAALLPFSDRLRLQGSLFASPPVDGLGRNFPASTGLTLALFMTWM